MQINTLAHETRAASSRTNDETTWSSVREKAETNLSRVWHDGALLRRKPEESFLVRCSQDTMTTDDILNGRLIYLIGLSLAAPPMRVMVLAEQPIGEELESRSQGRTTWRWFMEPEELSPSHSIGALIRQNKWKNN
jgi:phage tail sheath protein FI